MENSLKYLIQYMINHGSTTIDETINYMQNVPGLDDLNANSLNNLIRQADRRISSQNLRLMVSTCELSSAKRILLINTATDNVIKRQTYFNQAELLCFAAIFKELITHTRHRVHTMECYKKSASCKLSKDGVESLLNRLIKTGYFVQKDDYIYLGIRCIVEFTPYLIKNCKDYVSFCYLCKELVLVGSACQSCDVLMHTFCLEKYRSSSKKCPSCKAIFNLRNDEDSDD